MWRIKENMQLARKIRIYPTEEQVNVIWHLSEMVRVIYNLALADRQQIWHDEKRPVKYLEQQNMLPEFKKNNPEFKVVFSKMYQVILRKLDISYKSTLTKWRSEDYTAELPKFKSYKYIMNLPFNQSGFTIKDGKVTFSHYIKDAVPLTFEIGDIADGLKIKQLEICNDNSYKARGKFYLAITYEKDIDAAYFDNELYFAIDLGIAKIITGVNMQGEFFEFETPRPDKYWNPKINEAKSRRDHCFGGKKGQKHKSKKYLRLAKAVRKMSNKKTHQIKDILHKLSRKVTNKIKANTTIVGDLKVKKMAQPKIKNGEKQKKTKRQRGLNRSTQGLGFLSRFPQFLTYKMDIIGKKVIRIDEKYTSKMCCCCGTIHKEQELKDREMICDCGNHIDRDRNSAINIMIRFLSQYAPDSLSTFVGNLRHKGIYIISDRLHEELRFLGIKAND
jgi:putative transposase